MSHVLLPVSAALNSLCAQSLNIHLREFLTFLVLLYPLLHTYLIRLFMNVLVVTEQRF